MSLGYTLMKRIGKGAGHAPRSVDMWELQTKQLLFLRVKFFLRDNAAVKQFFELLEFVCIVLSRISCLLIAVRLVLPINE